MLNTPSKSLDEIIRYLRGIISSPDNVHLSERTVESDDMGNCAAIVVYPVDETEVCNVLRYANEHRLSVISEGGGTKRGFGGIEDTADILISFKRFSGVIEHSAGDLMMTVSPGTTLKDIQEHLALNGQFLPLDAPFTERSTIGGTIAANTSGPKRFRYGSCRDLVTGLRIVQPDGRVIRSGAKVVKNVAGYDMNKLYIGSMGTLGLITQIHLKLKPTPAFESLIILQSDNLDEIVMFSKKILDSYMEPVALELLNPSFSEALLEERSYHLLVSFEDVKKSVQQQENWVQKNLSGVNIQKILHNQKAADWWENFSIFKQGLYRIKMGSYPASVPKIIQFVEREANKISDSIRIHGSLGSGLSYLQFTEIDSDTFIQYIRTLRSYMDEQQGYAIIEKAPLHVRQQVLVWGEEQPHFRLMRELKQKIDPHGILNSGRFVGGI